MTNIGKYGSSRMVYGIPLYGDVVRPTTSIESSAFTVDGYARVSPVSFVVNFAEPVFDFTSADFSITNGSVQSILGTGDAYTTGTGDGYRSYSFEIVPTSAGTVLISIPGGNAFDASGNSITGDSYSFIYDNVGPIPTISSETVTNGGSTGNTTNSFTVTFDEPVFGFTSGDILITSGSGTVGNFSGSNGASVYTFDLTISSGASISFRVPSSVCQDFTGNNNSQSALFSFSGDITRPSVTITSNDVAANGHTNKSSIAFTITFSEPVTGFVVGDITASGGGATLSNFTAVSSTVYTVDYAPPSQGNRGISVPADVAQDAAGNLNEASESYNFNYDTISPLVELGTVSVDYDGYTNSSPVAIKFILSSGGFGGSPIAGFSLTDVIVSDGYVANLVVDGANHTFNHYPASEGLKTVQIPDGSFQDLAGNSSTHEGNNDTFRYYYDITRPSATITSSSVLEDGYTNSSPLNFTITFSEPVEDFGSEIFSVTNGTVSSFSALPSVYRDSRSFSVVPSGQGAVVVSVAAGSVDDRAGNSNTASNNYSFTYDSARPTVVISSLDVSQNGFSSLASYQFTITFSEPVTGFVIGDITTSGGSPSNFAGSGTTYTFDFTPSGQGSKTISVAEGVAVDSAGNTNTASSNYSFTFDSARPTVTITSISATNGGYSTLATIPFTITFSEAVTGFTGEEITVSGGTIDNFAGSGTTYTFDFVMSGQGSKSVSVAENVAQDSAGNLNQASSSYSFTYDSIKPTVALTASVAGVNQISGNQVTNPVINFGATFSEGVSGFVAGDIDVTNGSLSAFTSVSDSYYTFTVTAGTQGTVVVGIQAGVAQDSAGNTNSVASSFSIVFDNLGPSVTVTSGDIVSGGTTRLRVIPFTVTFGESVTGFEASDILKTNCTIGSFAGSGTTYTFNLLPTAIGAVSFTIPQNTVFDQYGNGSSEKVFNFFYGRGATGNFSGTLSADTVWVDSIRLTGRVIVPNGITLTIDPSAYIQSDGHSIIVENGGVLNTGTSRLPKNSILRSVVLITE